MKKSEKHLLLIILFCSISVLTEAQTPVTDGWIETGNAADNSELYSVAFSTSAIGYAVGSGGACLKTINGGSSWTAINLNVPYDLRKIVFFDTNTGYIGGGFGHEYGKVLKTTDGGISWQEVLDFTGTFNNMFFLDAVHGWIAAYEKVFSTADGGSTWTELELPGFNDILSIAFVTTSIGFITPNNASIGVQKTTNGGLTWSATLNRYTNDLETNGENTIFTLISYPGQVYKTTDQGSNWNSFSTGLTGSLKGINMVSESLGFVWSLDPNFGRIFRTSNAGGQWTSVYDNPSADINFVTASPGGQIIAVGAGGQILSSTNGTSWVSVHSGAISGALRRVAFMNNLSGFAVGDKGSVIKTSDGGVSWSPVNLGTQQNLKGLDFVSQQVGYLGGDGSTLYKTINGGTTWTPAKTGLDAPDFMQIVAWDEQKVFVGANSGVYVTENGGTTWSPTTYTSIAYNLFLINADTILAADIVKFAYSYDGGATWNTKSMPRTFFSMYFKTAMKGLVGDSWGRIYKTTDGMQTMEQKHNCGYAIWDMTFINDTVGYFVADNGYIGKTTDGGESWIQVESGTTRNLKSIFFTPDGTGFIVGKDGIILRKAAVKTFSIDFNISDTEGHPITDAVVTVNNAPYPSGTYHISGLIAGTYSYKVSKFGFKSFTDSVDIAADKVLQVTLEAGVDTPVALAATGVTNTGFVANWENVAAADSFLLYVSKDNFTGHLPGYNGLAVKGLDFAVTGLEPGVDYYYRLKAKNSSGLSSFSNTIIVLNVLGIEYHEIDPVVIFPNPATDKIKISSDPYSPERIEIIDLYGKLVLSKPESHKTGNLTELDISQLNPGVYLMRLLINKKYLLKKLIIL